MKAVVFHDVGDIRLDDVPEPKIEQPLDAIVRITTSALCGTDLHFVRTRREEMDSVIDAYKEFDLRRPGWLKVELIESRDGRVG